MRGSASNSVGVSRIVKSGDERNKRWNVGVDPSGFADVTITLTESPACGQENAICTSDGRALSNSPSITVLGPATISVADDTAEEGVDTTIDFVISLDRAATQVVTVDYATRDGTATAGEDYTETSGTARFEVGDQEYTVAVPLLDDAVDEDQETMTLTLSNAVGGRIEDGTAVGTIENDDPLQRAWLARFGRTVGG